MNFSLVFQNSGDSIPFIVFDNYELFEYFIDKVNSSGDRFFIDWNNHSKDVDELLISLSNSIKVVNKKLQTLTGFSLEQYDLNEKEKYLDQKIINRIHCDWVHSQDIIINIDELRQSVDNTRARLGEQLYDMIRPDIHPMNEYLAMAVVLTKLGLLEDYQNINDVVHKIERMFNFGLDYATSKRYQVIENPYIHKMNTTNGWCNFSFHYTFLGRKYYDKFVNFDSRLEFDDNFNFDKLEYTFNLNLRRPEKILFSQDFLKWASDNNVTPMGDMVPIANIPDLEDNLTKYRSIVYNNSMQKNKLTIEI